MLFNGADGDAQTVGDLGVGQVFEPAQDYDGPRAGREGVDNAALDPVRHERVEPVGPVR